MKPGMSAENPAGALMSVMGYFNNQALRYTWIALLLVTAPSKQNAEAVP